MLKKINIIFGIFVLLILISINSLSAVIICQYANSATATSENLNSSGSLAIHATGAPNSPDAQFVDQCTVWSGYGYSWSPRNWNIVANLTLKYNTPVKVTNLTIFGDYYMNWCKIKLKNSNTLQEFVVSDNYEDSCLLKKKLDGSFLADTVILETCGWDWSSTDAVQLCGETNNSNPPQPPQPNISNNIIQICDWKNCKSAAASVSVDDGFSSCRDKLNQYGFKGTYYLSSTNSFTPTQWALWNSIYQEGHEIGAHTNSHSCSVANKEFLRNDIESNIDDIFTHINNIDEIELTTFAWTCGIADEEAKNIAAEYFISARGYHTNQLEDKNPSDFMYIKSLNTPRYHEPYLEPPDYFQMTDRVIREGKWINYIFHNECNEPNIIDYIATKDIWVAPIGDVSSYIIERQNTRIQDVFVDENIIEFVVDNELDYRLSQELTFKVNTNGRIVKQIIVNGNPIVFSYTKGNAIFSFFPDGWTLVEIKF